MEETRIYVVVAGTIQVPVAAGTHKPPLRTVVQPVGRQIAQACHVVSKLRHRDTKFVLDHREHSIEFEEFKPITTIILQARDSAELGHVHFLLHKKKLNPILFSDENPQYGPGEWPTAIAALANKKQIEGILDYLPLWGA
jgi:hypothetical protein